MHVRQRKHDGRRQDGREHRWEGNEQMSDTIRVSSARWGDEATAWEGHTKAFEIHPGSKRKPLKTFNRRAGGCTWVSDRTLGSGVEDEPQRGARCRRTTGRPLHSAGDRERSGLGRRG